MTCRAALRWAALSTKQQQTFGNGCGPNWLPDWMNKVVNRYLFGWLYEASCRRHDFAYARGGDGNDRLCADRGYFLAMVRDTERLAERGAFLNHVLARGVAWLYFVLVRMFGWMTFNYGPYRNIKQLIETGLLLTDNEDD